MPPQGTALIVGRICTVYYFLHFLVIMPVLGWIERPRPLPPSIADAVLAKKGGGGMPAAATAAPEHRG
jgi:ubiquinol-cytochrome c reductase cytochrome b subunit